jgi:hypothetical protein
MLLQTVTSALFEVLTALTMKNTVVFFFSLQRNPYVLEELITSIFSIKEVAKQEAKQKQAAR